LISWRGISSAHLLLDVSSFENGDSPWLRALVKTIAATRTTVAGIAGRMIPKTIKMLLKEKNFLRTRGYTQLASFALILIDDYCCILQSIFVGHFEPPST
jgi:hypothetical protein